MARVRLLTAVSGTRGAWQAGDTLDVPGAEASAWVASGRAELVRGEGPETTGGVPGEGAPAEGASEKPGTARRKPRTKKTTTGGG